MKSFFRTANLPPYPLGEIAARLQELRLMGRDVVDLSQVNPNLGPPAVAVDKLVQAALKPHNHRYSSSQGIARLRSALASWYGHRWKVTLDVDQEIVATMGNKEGIAHLLLAVLSPGDTVLVPTPSYPIHTAAISIAGASFVGVPIFENSEVLNPKEYLLTAESEGFFSRLEQAYLQTWPRAKMIICNFPHNPTSAVVEPSFFERLVDFAKKNEVYIVHDFAYADICFDDYRAPSILSVPGAKEVAVECYSLSKGFGLAGWRVGFCVGCPQVVAALKRIKGYLDFGIFQPLQIAATALLEEPWSYADSALKEVVVTYLHRRDLFVDGLTRLGWNFVLPKAGVFIWAELPEQFQKIGGLKFSRLLLEEAGVAICPGEGFDATTSGFVRFAIVENEARLRKAIQGLEKICA